MMKQRESAKSAGVITCHWAYNYGAVLQTYALQEVLKSIGVNPFVINYYPPYYLGRSTGLLKKIIRPAIRSVDSAKGKKVFGQFLDKEIKLSQKVITNKELINNPPKADCYIAGSDQIWNCDMPNGYDDAFFLDFAPDNTRKVSYAASIATKTIPESQKKRFYNLLQDFKAISVREKSAVDIIKDVGIKNVSTVYDPVYLLTADEWDVIAQKGITPEEKYVLIYGFERPRNIYRYAYKLANKLNCKVYAINTIIEEYLLGSDKYFWNATPYTFVNLVKNAEAVVTNSFHGVSFSIIYNRPFHLFPKKGSSGNSRMLDLLQDLNLSNRIIKDEDILPNKIDYSRTNRVIAKKRQASINFLKRALGINSKEDK